MKAGVMRMCALIKRRARHLAQRKIEHVRERVVGHDVRAALQVHRGGHIVAHTHVAAPHLTHMQHIARRHLR